MTEARERIISSNLKPGPAGIFVPWVGSKVVSAGGLYYVGIATDNDCYPEDQSPKLCLKWSSFDDIKGPHERSHAPYWRSLESLSKDLLGAPYFEKTDNWGWSNIIKIAGADGPPNTWSEGFIDAQRDACIMALKEELLQQTRSLIFIASKELYGILDKSLPDDVTWNKSQENTGVWFSHHSSGNIYIWGYHPGHARRARFFEKQLNATINIARMLSWSIGNA